MKLVVDENISLAIEAFEGFGELLLINGREINTELLRDKDALIVRSITKVDKTLLENTNVKFVGTATIGTDHIDLNYLASKNINFADAKGCNADSVAEYVFTALLKTASEKKFPLVNKTIGIVGIGNIGGRIVRLAEAMGMNVLKNDPPLQRSGTGSNYVPFNEILAADIITLHVPLTLEGADKTFHLINETNLKKIKPGTIIINTSRGAVIDNEALLEETLKKKFLLILDVWEGEPSININLTERTVLGTAHIAGYSLEGKVNGTKMIYDSLCRYLKYTPAWTPDVPAPVNAIRGLPEGKSEEERLYKLFSSIYNVEKDDSLLKEMLNIQHDKRSVYFDMLRKTYPTRREFSNFIVRLRPDEMLFKPILEAFRFKVEA